MGYRLVLEIGELPRTNASDNRHWSAKTKDRERWAVLMRDALGRQARPPEPLPVARVEYVRRSTAECDPSNLPYSFKLIEDLLCPDGPHNPGGLSILAGDKAENYRGGIGSYRWEKSKRANQGVTITVEEP